MYDVFEMIKKVMFDMISRYFSVLSYIFLLAQCGKNSHFLKKYREIDLLLRK